jgi:hypothetical protein
MTTPCSGCRKLGYGVWVFIVVAVILYHYYG